MPRVRIATVPAHINRRAFVLGALGLGAGAAALGALTAWPRSQQGETASRVRRIGFLVASDRAASAPSIEAFLEALRARDWVEGDNLAVEWREARGQEEASPSWRTS